MTNDEFWALKIVALLHDPPGKALDLDGHEPRAFACIERIIGPTRFQSLFGEPAARLKQRRDFDRLKQSSLTYRRLKRADAVASAMDRGAGFPRQIQVPSSRYVPTATVVHPLSGRPRPLPDIQQRFCDEQRRYDQAAADAFQVAQLQEAERLAGGQPDLRRAYLRLWRGLPTRSPDVDAALLPPDTRIVDHSLWQHLDATAAVFTALPQPSLMVFSIGPVQSFVAEARRTQDLWMGSYILSYLAWAAIRRVVEEAGPEVALYPALRGQPLVDYWLYHAFDPPLWDLPTPAELSIATLPNKFVALLPFSEAPELARAATEAVRETWLAIAADVKGRFPGGAQPNAWEVIWRRQVEAKDWPEIYWAVLPWPNADQYPTTTDEAEAAISLEETYLGRPSRFRQAFDVYKQAWPAGINSGTLYGRLHALAARGVGARKGLRNFLQSEEDGEKCTVSGVRSALRTGQVQPRKVVSEYWRRVAEDLRDPTENRYHEVKPDGSERLSAIVAVKRFAQREHFQQKLGLKGGYPSTSRIAAAPFLGALLENLSKTELAQAVQAHVSVLKHLGRDPQGRRGFPRLSNEAVELALPYLWRRAEGNPLAVDFLHYDADVLYEQTFNRERLKREYGLDADASEVDQARDRCRALLRAAREAGISPPATYYAVLLLDGDSIGEWLSGERLPRFREVLHPAALSLFEQLPNFATEWQPILEKPRPLSAALHNSVSLALFSFALKAVPQVVEMRYPGRVVYAGGDDVLALLPAECALAAARELRSLYSGQATVNVTPIKEWQVQPDFTVDHTGYLVASNQVILTMGLKATASVGIAIAHHQAPLDGVLAAAREAVEAAKQIYGANLAPKHASPDKKNAICVYALKRSGEALRVGTRWTYERAEFDSIALVEQVRGHFRAEDELSSKFAYEVSSEAHGLALTRYDRDTRQWQSALPLSAITAALKRLAVKRQKGENLSEEDAGQLAERLARFAEKLDAHRQRWESKWRQEYPGCDPDPFDEELAPQPGVVELSKWLLLARFLEWGGEE